VDNDGHYIDHYWSCGPIALEQALNRKGNMATSSQISKEIQENGNFIRTFLAMCDIEAISITLPGEMKQILKQHGYKTITLKSFEKLDPKKDTAIILTHRSGSLKSYHWACFPVQENILSLFRDKTKIDKIYLLKKIN
tara:strand:+ start:654 stop:1067 length:414 start_codon:yes stop_codon:yes gene_type:complete